MGEKIDDETKKRKITLKNLTSYTLALVLGAVIFFPSINSSIKPPYIYDSILYAFWISSSVSILLLCIAFYFAAFTKDVPEQTAGLGNIAGAFALLFLTIYAGINLVSDRISPPKIVEITVEPRIATPGESVKLSAVGNDQDSDDLEWNWSVLLDSNIHSIGQGRVVYWTIPETAKPGQYTAAVILSDDGGNKDEKTLEILVGQSKRELGVKNMEAYLNDRIETILAKYVRDNPRKKTLVSNARQAIFKLASENVTSITAIQDDPKALEDALENYLNISEKSLRDYDFRPCCKDYPGIWPFCTRKC